MTPRQNYTRVGQAPTARELLVLEVVDRVEISPSFVRVTLAGPAAARLTRRGADQWARVFIPTDDGTALSRIPARLTPRSYLSYVGLDRAARPLMRSYTIAPRDDRVHGTAVDVDFLVHSDGAAARWAQQSRPGQSVGLIDQGTGFTFPAGPPVHLVGDSSAVPAIAGILASLPADAVGRVTALVTPSDRRELPHPRGVEVNYVDDECALRGSVTDNGPPPRGVGWVAGEASLVVDVRRAWLDAGLPKDRMAFCGFWRRR